MKRLIFLAFICISITNYSCKKCEGCTNPKAENYNKDADTDDGSCIVKGCTNPKAQNYDPKATVNDGNCLIKGCTNPASSNYDPEANVDDGSCVINGCTDPTAINYNAQANTDDGTCKYPKDLFIGNWVAMLDCDNEIIQNFVAAQAIDIIIEEIPNEKTKVKLSIGFAIPGLEPTTGTITGNLLTYENPEQTLTLPQIGEIKVKSSGQVVAGADPNKLTGEIVLSITLQGFPIVSTCTYEAIRKL